MHHKYFVGHKAPNFKIWPDFCFFAEPDRLSPEGVFNEKLNDDRVFSEYSSLFWLCRQLNSASPQSDDLITICQHRRFVLNTRMGSPAKNLPANVIAYDAILGLNFDRELFPRFGQRYLLGSVLKFDQKMVDQYAGAHYIRDLLRFCSDLIDAGLMTDEEVNDFLNQKFMIPAPSCGTFDLQVFIGILGFLEVASEIFLKGGYKPYEDRYQARVLSFLLERLHSWLLLKQVIRMSLSFEHIVGFTTIVSDDPLVQPG